MVAQVYAILSDYGDEQIEDFYAKLQAMIDRIK